MINRVADHEAKSKTPATGEFPGFDIPGLQSPDFKKYLGSAEGLILKYPGPALVSAFLVGVVVAWWIKRK